MPVSVELNCEKRPVISGYSLACLTKMVSQVPSMQAKPSSQVAEQSRVLMAQAAGVWLVTQTSVPTQELPQGSWFGAVATTSAAGSSWSIGASIAKLMERIWVCHPSVGSSKLVTE